MNRHATTAPVTAEPERTTRPTTTLDALILAELDRCDRLGVEPGIDHMRLVSERRRASATG